MPPHPSEAEPAHICATPGIPPESHLTEQPQLDPDAVALGLIGVLEVLWQDIAFQDESQIDRPMVKHRAMSYLRSLFPGRFDGLRGAALTHEPARLPVAASSGTWQLAGHIAQLPAADSVLTVSFGSGHAAIQRERSGLAARRIPDAAKDAANAATIEVCERDGFIFLLKSLPPVN